MKIPAMVMLGNTSFISASLNMIRQKAYIRQSLSLILCPCTLGEHKKRSNFHSSNFYFASFCCKAWKFNGILWSFIINDIDRKSRNRIFYAGNYRHDVNYLENVVISLSATIKDLLQMINKRMFYVYIYMLMLFKMPTAILSILNYNSIVVNPLFHKY